MAIPSASCWAGIRVVAAGLFVLTSAVSAMAQQGSANLPLKRVVLFSSGVGFFEHDGQVEGNADVQMKFNVRDINDLLKSMVVEDLGGGQISTVTYGSKDPITKTLKSFAIDLTTNPTLFDLLQQVRGERVELDVGMPDKITGVILGLEKRKDRVGEKEVIESQVLNLLTDKGLRSVELNTVSSIKLMNDKLDGELRKALTLLATSHDTDKKTVALNFLGEKKRRVRVGYIQESPVWKTSYRLVLDDDKSPFLQGWAIVENTTEEDWSGVSLTLVSGRPISFTMDLYQPLYVPRPAEQLELYSSLRPQVYGQDLERREAEFFGRATAAVPAAAKSPMHAGRAMAERKGGKEDRLKFSVGVESEAGLVGSVLMEKQADSNWQLQQGVQSAAAARDVGSLFQYAIRTPVNLPRQQSAMLPIVNGEIKGEKVSIYNQAVQAKHPLNGLKMTNTTDLHLMQGPITVLDDGVYAGDAKIDDLPPGSERLISYAMDLDTEVAPEVKHRPSQILKVRLLKGGMYVDNKFARATEYTVKNSGRKAKKVLIESPLEPEWKLVAPKEPTEKTRDKYRFAVEAKPGQPAKLLVEEERTEQQQIALSNLEDNMVLLYRNAREVSDRVKAALAETVKQRQAIQQLAEKRGQLEGRIRAIGEDQARIRQNMVQLDRTSEIYKTYVKKFSDQEAEIERLRTQIAEFQAQENQLRKALDDYLIGLDLD
jgi:hypothetical protein